MKIYIAGPMTGREHYNHAEFMRVAERMTALGHKVRTPFTASTTIWRLRHGLDFDPVRDKCEYSDPVLAEMFLMDIEFVLWADQIVLLPGWLGSRGANIEVAVARLFNRPLIDAVTLRPIKLIGGIEYEVLHDD